MVIFFAIVRFYWQNEAEEKVPGGGEAVQTRRLIHPRETDPHEQHLDSLSQLFSVEGVGCVAKRCISRNSIFDIHYSLKL